MIISSSNEQIKQFIKLHDKKYRFESQMFLVEGEHMVREALLAGDCVQVITTNLEEYPVETIHVSENVMRKLSDVKTSPGVIGVCKIRNQKRIFNRILLLDHIQDPGNLGTIIRSAIAFGYETIIADGCVDIYNSKVLRATQGGIFNISYIEQSVVEFMKNNPDYIYYAGVVDHGLPLSKVSVESNKTGLIIGNEAKGISQEVLALTNHLVTIEMFKIESLNASIAASILMYSLHR